MSWCLSPIVKVKARKAAMQNLEDANVVEKMSVPGRNGQEYFFKVVDVLKPGRRMETVVEVLGFRSSALSSQAWRNHANDSFE